MTHGGGGSFGWRTALIALIVGLVARQAEPQASPPGEGIGCALAVFSAVAEVGSRCFNGQDQEVQIALQYSVSRLERFIVQNSNTTTEEIEKFKQEQGRVGAPEALLCHGDGPSLYKHFRTLGAARIRAEIDEMVARPGTPTFGSCL